MNSIWSAIVADFKAGLSDVETMIGRLWAVVEADAKGLPGMVSNLISTDANILVADYQADLQAIVVNIQNSTLSLSLANFPALFMTAVLPIVEKEGLKILDEDWTLISAYFAANNKIGITPANNGTVGS
jgi:hypothetical protein